jgi:hypothetical protein
MQHGPYGSHPHEAVPKRGQQPLTQDALPLSPDPEPALAVPVAGPEGEQLPRILTAAPGPAATAG